MILTILSYFIKIGIPSALISYAFKLKYQDKYLKDIAEYIFKIKDLDTELLIKDTELKRGQLREEVLLQEIVELRTQLGLDTSLYYDEDFQRNLGKEIV